MIKINIITNNNGWKNYIKNPKKYFEKNIKRINKGFIKYRKNIIYFTLLLSGDKEIRKLNKQFRKKNKTTDVLSFPFYNKKDLVNKLKRDKEVYLGDIILNLNKINDKNKNFKNNFNKLWIHGLVHLFGYKHKKDKDFYHMRKIEKKFVSFLK
tara:strand:- start:775 stop:1233 length:459 start_codon:yes stop_codon:yes gene_type:complete